MSTADSSTLSVAAFTALGTIVGYLGTEVASSSIFSRMLWVSRFCNDASLKSYIAYIFLMPIGGPIHKAAIEALDGLVSAGLWKGYCRGDMLGTEFFEDTKQIYGILQVGGGHSSKADARNGFWVTVLSLVPWEPQMRSVPPRDKEAVEKHEVEVRSQRPVHHLRLSRADLNSREVSGSALPIIEGDVGGVKIRHIAAVLSSELITLIVGIITATVWKSFFAIWYLTPLLVKLIALFCHVRRKQIAPLSDNPGDTGSILCEIEDSSQGIFLIEGKSELVLQFFRHYGHPQRYRRSFFGDRFWEVVSMLTLATTAFVYPAGLIAFIFAPISIQWVWLGYQLYATIAMHIYRFGGGQHIGTTQEWIARELHRKGQVLFDDGGGNKVVAHLETSLVSSVSEGRRTAKSIAERVLLDHALH